MNKMILKEFGYHGDKVTKPYFEGWYFKITNNAFSMGIIVGVNQNTEDDHGFIQTLDTISGESQYIRFPLTDVHITNEPFHIRIGDNHFYKDTILLDLHKHIPIKMHVKMGNFEPLKPTLYAPTIMGPFSYIPGMECIHTAYSLYHQVCGQLSIEHKDIDLTNAIGYIEKDRGTSFPTKYFWLQSNHMLNQEKACLFLSIATIPLNIMNFTGLIMVLMIGGEQLRFGSYYGGKVKVLKKTDNTSYKIIIEQGKYRVCIKAYLGKTFALSAPSSGEMNNTVDETLNATALVHVYKKDRLFINASFINAGCEVRDY